MLTVAGVALQKLLGQLQGRFGGDVLEDFRRQALLVGPALDFVQRGEIVFLELRGVFHDPGGDVDAAENLLRRALDHAGVAIRVVVDLPLQEEVVARANRTDGDEQKRHRRPKAVEQRLPRPQSCKCVGHGVPHRIVTEGRFSLQAAAYSRGPRHAPRARIANWGQTFGLPPPGVRGWPFRWPFRGQSFC